MTLTPETTPSEKQTLRAPDGKEDASEPKPWTAPDFVERSTCAEIGAYAFQDR